jgi:hypothetical protein
MTSRAQAVKKGTALPPARRAIAPARPAPGSGGAEAGGR